MPAPSLIAVSPPEVEFGGLAIRRLHFEPGFQERSALAAELTKTFAAIVEERSDQLRQREHVLAMRHRCEQVVLQPLAVGEQRKSYQPSGNSMPRVQVDGTVGFSLSFRRKTKIGSLSPASYQVRRSTSSKPAAAN